MNAEIIAVGTELLLGQTTDTNSTYVGKRLAELGINLYRRQTVGDNVQRLQECISVAIARANIVITIGGLGPTADDITKECVSVVMENPLVRDESHEQWLIERSKGKPSPPETSFKQADVPSRGRGVANTVGTALGAIFEGAGTTVICLPGPPVELEHMMTESVMPYLAKLSGGMSTVLHSTTIHVVGLGEPIVEDRIKDLIEGRNPTVAPYAKTSEVHLRVTARGKDTAAARKHIEPTVQEILRRMGPAAYGQDQETLGSVLVTLLKRRKETVAVAESCTGGLVSKRIVDVPDASAVFPAGIVSYSNDAKTNLLNVPERTISDYGAVSPEAACAMADGVRIAAGSTYGISTTGIAGPGGGTQDKPVGTVHIGLATAEGTVSEKFRYIGDRATVMERASQAALDILRRHLLRNSS